MTDNKEKPQSHKLPELKHMGIITPEEWAEAQSITRAREKASDAWLEEKFKIYDENQKKLKEAEQGKIKPPEQG
jgi:hypothetical protein